LYLKEVSPFREIDKQNDKEEDSFLEMKGIRKSFPGVQALKGVDLSIGTGEVRALVGENGSGKSTLVKILYGQYRMDAGQILISGENVQIHNPHVALTLGIAYISQEITLVPTRSVAENILIGKLVTNRYHIVNHSKMYLRTKNLLESLNVDINPRGLAGDLSPNSQQMVAIARALSSKAKLIVMDEVTSVLTGREVGTLFEVINRLKTMGISFIFITHRLKEVFEICDQVTVLRDGEKITDAPVKGIDEAGLIKHMVGRSLVDYFYKEPCKLGSVLLKVEDLSSPPLLENIRFKILKGEILGLAGLVGSGRSELAMCLIGRRRITNGAIWFEDKKITIRSPRQAFKRGIAFIPEDRKRQATVLPLSVKDNFSLACLQFLSAVSRFGIIKRRTEILLANRFIDRLRIKTPGLGAQIQWLSGGNQQKVVLARWLVRNPKVFILDEPTRGIDVGAKSEIYKIMSEIVKSGSSVLMISSELPEILGLSDRILVMFQGRVVKELSREDATEEKIAFYATGQKDQG